MRIRASRTLAACFAAAAMIVSGAARANLVKNGGFETGTFENWTEFGNTSWNGVDMLAPYDGTNGAYFGPVTPEGQIDSGGISQTLSTIDGATYQVSFWLQNEADPNGDSISNSFEFKWGGAVVEAMTDAFAFDYKQYTYSLTATSGSTDMRFTFGHVVAFWDLDSVSVEAVRATVPEPGSLALVSLAGLLAVLPRRRRS